MINRSIFWMCVFSVLILGCTQTRAPVVTPSPETTATVLSPAATLSPAPATATSTQDLYQSTERPASTYRALHPSPSTTNTPNMTATPNFSAILDGKLIIVRNFSTNYLEDLTTGHGFVFLAEGRWVDVLQWRANGCTLIAGMDDGIYEVNLQGEIVRPIFTFDSFPEVSDGTIHLTSSIHRYAYYPLSPDDTWLAYLIGSGNIEDRGDDLEPYRYEYQNLETMSTDGTEGPYRLSQRGGVRRVAWSPDGQRLAFSDYDAEGISQLFVATRDGSNLEQLTSLTQPMEMGRILWSPDGERIALYVSQIDTWAIGGTYIIEKSADTFNVYEDIQAAWWRDNDSLIARRRISREQSSIIVMDVTTGEISSLGEMGCYCMNPFGNLAMVGCWTVDDQIWVYDSITHTVEQYPNFDPFWSGLIYPYFIAAPDSYPGDAGCNYSP